MTRSNRQLTQFAIKAIQDVLLQGPEPSTTTAGNTEITVDCCTCGRPPNIIVRLFGKEILRVYTSPLNHRKVVGVKLATGEFHDSKGRPSRTTRERQNGILDALGADGILPHTRVFIKDNEGCYVGDGSNCRPFDVNSQSVAILSHPTDLMFA